MKEKKYFFYYTLISLISAATSFFTMFALTRILSEENYGRVNLFFTASNVVMSISCLGLDSAYIRYYYEYKDSLERRKMAFHCIFPSVLFLCLISFILVVISNNPWARNFIGGSGYVYAFFFVLSAWGLYIIRYLTIFFRMSGIIISFALVSILLVVLSKTSMVVTSLIFNEYILNIYISSCLIAFFSIIFLLVYIKRILKIDKIQLNKYSDVYRYALLCAPVFAIIYLNGYFPQIIISNKLGEKVLGVYSVYLLFCSAIQVISTGFTTFWSPYMFKNFNDKNQIIKNIHDIVVVGAVVVLSMLLLFSDILYMFIGSNLRKNQEFLGLFLIYPIFVVLVETTSYGISIKKKNEISLCIYFLMLIINVIFSYLLVNKFNLLGIAVASVVSSCFFLVFMTYYGQKFYQSVNNIKKTYINILFLLVISISFYLFYSVRIIFVIIDLIILLFVLFLNKDIIRWGQSIVKKNTSQL